MMGILKQFLLKRLGTSIEKFNLIKKVLTGNLNDKNIYYFKTSKIKISSKQPLEISIDGEYGGSKEIIEITNLKQNIEYILPKRE